MVENQPIYYKMIIPDGDLSYEVQIPHAQIKTPQKSHIQTPVEKQAQNISYKCQVVGCTCTGWANLNSPSAVIHYRDPCKCGHFLNVHTIYSKNKAEPESPKIINMPPNAQINTDVILEYQYSDQHNTMKTVSEETMVYLLGLKTTKNKAKYTNKIRRLSISQSRTAVPYSTPVEPLPPKQSYQRNLERVKLNKFDTSQSNIIKLQKISLYSSCQAENCECRGWTKVQFVGNFQLDLCRCEHLREMHILHMRDKNEEELNRILRLVFDIENMFILMNQSEELYVVKVYTFLIKILLRCIPTLERPLIKISCQPPFETPSIHTGISNLVLIKFNHMPREECAKIHEMAMIFLHCLNLWDLPVPSNGNHIVGDDRVYKKDYLRWFVFCHVPTYFGSFERFDTTKAFGFTLLRVILKPFIVQLHQIGVRLSPTRRNIFEQYFPIFLDALEKEVYLNNSDILGANLRLQVGGALSHSIRESPSYAKR